MIQPLKSPKNTWFVYWLDLEEPVPSSTGWFLPTLVIICDRNGSPIAPPEILEELDQSRVENLLYKLFDQFGCPDRISLSASNDWDPPAWEAFSNECKVEIRFLAPDAQSSEELKSLTKTLVLRVGRSGDSPTVDREIALGLVQTALKVRSSEKKETLLRAALARDPECSQARIEMADIEFQRGNWKTCLAAYEEIIHRDSHRKIAPVTWWIDRTTRPFLRAIYGKAMTQWHLGRYANACSDLEELLELNPTDNQGARFLIPMLHLLSESTEHAAGYFHSYLDKYPDDYTEPAFLFGWALTSSLVGQEQESRMKYAEGILKNIYIAPALLELPEPPRNIWVPNDRAEPNYAAEFVESYAVLWDREPGALRILREVYEEMIPRVKRLIQHRDIMTDYQDQRYEPHYKSKWADLVAEDEQLMKIDHPPLE